MFLQVRFVCDILQSVERQDLLLIVNYLSPPPSSCNGSPPRPPQAGHCSEVLGGKKVMKTLSQIDLL